MSKRSNKQFSSRRRTHVIYIPVTLSHLPAAAVALFWGCHSSVVGDSRFLACYAVTTGKWSPTFPIRVEFGLPVPKG